MGPLIIMLAKACEKSGLPADCCLHIGWNIIREENEEGKLTATRLADEIQDEVARMARRLAMRRG
jgi:hypothetical protein